MDLLEEVSGNRVNYAMPTVGGVRRDLPKAKHGEWHKMLDKLAEWTEYYIKVASTKQTILERAVGVGYLSKEDMIRLSVACDIRHCSPYLIYDEIDFDHVVVDNGDALGQVLVRVLETLESVKICKWCWITFPRER